MATALGVRVATLTVNTPRPTLAAVVRTQQGRFRRQVATSAEQRRVLSDITACRTQVLGGHVYQCERCGHRKVAYNPCGHRHCPQCQATARAEWLDQRLLDLLPVLYFHVVFTLPHPLAPLALQNPRIVYGILFRAVAETLLELGETRLAARCGFLAVLHTWGQTLGHHPHLHCVVPGGGIALDGSRCAGCVVRDGGSSYPSGCCARSSGPRSWTTYGELSSRASCRFTASLSTWPKSVTFDACWPPQNGNPGWSTPNRLSAVPRSR